MVRPGMRDRLRRVRRGRDASIAYRIVTAGCVLLSVIAAVTQGAVGPVTGIAAIALIPVGFVFAYVRRHKRNVVLKLLLTVGLMLVFAQFINAVRGATSIDDTRAPLVGLFLWVQVLHSFDVPRSRDLTFSVAASVVLVALAGSLAFSTGFIVYVLAFAVLFAAALALGHLDDLRNAEAPSKEVAPPTVRASARGSGRRLGALFGVITVATSVVFVFIPRLGVTQLASLPFSLGGNSPIAGFNGGVMLPGLRGPASAGRAFDPNSYFGFGEGVDLRTRGRLSHELVMRVRAPRPSLYRAQAFDTYRGGTWDSSDHTLADVHGDGVDPISVPDPVELHVPVSNKELTQTFYIERDLPNIIFHAYRAREVYVSSTVLRIDKFQSLRLPFIVEKDSIYSVVSSVPDVTPEALRNSRAPDPTDEQLQPYLQLPKALQGRFATLARRITADAATSADKADAVQDWIHANKEYRLDISRDPPGIDPVDYFVFDRKDGFCEQIAATMALMLRASGVPTRLVTGFGPGERNLFTGYWEVRNSDSHAWVEVFYPDYGWIPYDPTFGTPESSAANTTFMLAPLKKIASAFPAFASDVRGFVGRVIPGPDVAAPIVVIAMLAFLALAMRSFRRVRARARPPDMRAVDTWMVLERALARRRLKRKPNETVGEFAERVASTGIDVRDEADGFGAFRYGTSDDGFDEWDERVRELARTVRR